MFRYVPDALFLAFSTTILATNGLPMTRLFKMHGSLCQSLVRYVSEAPRHGSDEEQLFHSLICWLQQWISAPWQAHQFPWLPWLSLAACLVGPLASALLTLGAGAGPDAATLLCTATSGAVLGTLLHAAAALIQSKWWRGAAARAQGSQQWTQHSGQLQREVVGTDSRSWLPCRSKQQPRCGAPSASPCRGALAVVEPRFGPSLSGPKRPQSTCGGAARSWLGAAAGRRSGVSAYAEALRAVRGCSLASYDPIVPSTNVHLHVSGMQPEQLSPIWQAELERRFAEQGWCLLNVAVRRGSTYVSLTLANLRSRRATATLAAAAATAAVSDLDAVVDTGAPFARPGAPSGMSPDSGGTAAGTCALYGDAGLLGGPEELLASLGMRSADLIPGFSFSVQSVLEDGRCHRAQFTWHPESGWVKQPLAAGEGVLGGGSDGVEGSRAGPSRDRRSAEAVCSRQLSSIDETVREEKRNTAGGPPKHSGDGGEDVTTTETVESGTLHAPYVLLGVPEVRQRGVAVTIRGGDVALGVQRYEAEVRLRLPEQQQSNAGGSAAETCASNGIIFHARPVGWRCGTAELQISQSLLISTTDVEGDNRGCVWALTIWDEVTLAVEDLPAVAMPQRADRSSLGTGGGVGEDECGAPLLVDLSAWRGEELVVSSMLLLVPRARPTATCVWGSQLQELLQAHPAEVAQHILVDLGLMLSGAFDGAVALAPQESSREADEPEEPRTAAAGGLAGLDRSRQLVLMLDLGVGLLSLTLRSGCCALAELLWRSLERLGFGAEEVLLHNGGVQGDMPLLHAAASSGEPQPVALVLRWYNAAGLPEPWLQAVRLADGPAVLTPLVLASAASPGGALLLYIVRNHPQAVAAWRIPVNGGASGRSVAAAAGLWAIVLEVDLRAAVAPVAGAAFAAWQRLLLPEWLKRLRAHCRAACSSFAMGSGRDEANADVPGATSLSAGSRPGTRACFPAQAVGRGALAPAIGKDVTRAARIGVMDFNMFIARRTRTQMVAFQLVIVMYQLLAQLKALIGAFEHTCPLAATAAATFAASPSGWARLHVVRLVGRCVAGRMWWTVVEVAMVVVMASPLGLRYHTVCCACAAATRCAFQGLEGILLPPSEMSATGNQMTVAHVLFVLVTACCYQAPFRLNILLRLAEGFGATRMYLKYGVTSQLRVAVVHAMGMEAVGWLVGAALRCRAFTALTRKQRGQQL